VIIPVRSKPLVLAATVYETVETYDRRGWTFVPALLLAEETVIQETLLAAVKVQPACVVTAILPFPPPGPNDSLAGEIE
jgi:hypothetical protein